MQTLNPIFENYAKEYGYMPTLFELADLYRCGDLLLTDKQEDDLLNAMDLLNL